MTIKEAHALLTKSAASGRCRSYEWRMRQLNGVKRFLEEHQASIELALHEDLHKGRFEALGLELLPVFQEIQIFQKNLKQWMEPEFTWTPAFMAPATSETVYEPFGTCLIFGAFNYPLTLTLMPMLGAFSAGNCVCLKPSELTREVERLLVDVLPTYLDQDCMRVVSGDHKISEELLKLRWDKIFFTGSPRVGRLVLRAAAEFMTPCTLELGGKSPTIIDESVTDLDLAAKRIMWGKTSNAGQTCIAPDYVLCHEKHYDAFLAKAAAYLKTSMGADAQQAPDYGRIASTLHCDRLKTLMEGAKGDGANVYYGGRIDVKDRYIEPTILTDVPRSSAVMTEEIFGPLLVVHKYRTTAEAIAFVRETGEKPLTMYIFAKSRAVVDALVAGVQSGSVLVNDTMYSYGNRYAPFGGVGNSGMGNYFGRFSFTCFSQQRSILRRDDHTLLDLPIRYPSNGVYPHSSLQIFTLAFKYLPPIPPLQRKHLQSFGVVVGVLVVAQWLKTAGVQDVRSLGLVVCKLARWLLSA